MLLKITLVNFCVVTQLFFSTDPKFLPLLLTISSHSNLYGHDYDYVLCQLVFMTCAELHFWIFVVLAFSEEVIIK